MSKIEIDWEGKFGGEPEPLDQHVQEAVGKFRDALEKAKRSQDPILKKILRKEALDLLNEAVIVLEASNMRKTALERLDISEN